ncbi:MAG: hypothetical protein M0Z65_02930 [Firmicutes bacterium]|nr:hypothetical protein [Bacillota bacterium]
MKKGFRWFRVILTMAITLSLVISPTLEAKPKSTPKENGWFVMLPGDEQEAAKLQKQLENGATPADLNLPSGKVEKRSFQSLDKLQQEDAQTKETYAVKVDPPVKVANRWVPPKFEYDYISKDECIRQAESNRDKGWIKNHFAWCRSKIVSYGWQRYRFPLPIPITYGIQYRITEIGYGTNSQDKDKKEREVFFDYYIDDIYTTHPFLNGAKLKVDIDCQALVQPEDCKEKGGPIERTIAQWKSNNYGSKTLYSTPPPKSDFNPEQKGYMEFYTHQVMNPPQNLPTRTLDSPKQKVRWDSADYMMVIHPNQRFYNAGIFSDVRPVIHFSKSAPHVMREQAQHIEDALKRPETTYPYPGPGKIIPGGTYEAPLSRLRDKSAIKRNRGKSQRTCKRLHRDGVLPKPANSECDEFPFASTWQGASTGGVGKYSVRYISKDSNQAGGAWIAAWYAYDRILGRDLFNVKVVP